MHWTISLTILSSFVYTLMFALLKQMISKWYIAQQIHLHHLILHLFQAPDESTKPTLHSWDSMYIYIYMNIIIWEVVFTEEKWTFAHRLETRFAVIEESAVSSSQQDQHTFFGLHFATLNLGFQITPTFAGDGLNIVIKKKRRKNHNN